MRKKIGIICTLLISMLIFTNQTFANNNIITQEEAENIFVPAMDYYFEQGDPTVFGFDSVKGSITFGDIVQVHTFRPEFLEENADETKGIIATSEWVAPIYQNGKPVNVIGAFREPDGIVNMSTLGYGESLARGLKSINEGEILIYEFPVDGWYALSEKNNRIRPVDSSAKTVAKNEISLKSFKKNFKERYDEKESTVEGEYLPEKPLEENSSSLTLFMLFSIPLLFTFIIYRKKRASM